MIHPSILIMLMYIYIIHSSLKQTFRFYETFSEVWEHENLLYINDTQRLYGVCQKSLQFYCS